MTYIPPPSSPGAAYEMPAPRRSRLAIAALVLGIIGLLPLVGIPFGIAALVCGIMALVQAGRPPHNLTGKGFAICGIVMAGVGVLVTPVLALMLAILLPSLGKARELANRSYCAANLRGIAQSMIVYSNENTDFYPTMPYAPYSPANAGTSATTGAANEDDTLKILYSETPPQAGSSLASVWLLVMRNQTSGKQFICKSDPNTTEIGKQQNPSGTYYTNFQADNQLSYSFAYPYAPDGKIGRWWSNTADSSLPIAADMAPRNGTGTPTRNVAPGILPSSMKSWNSANHQGDGENVVFADCHAEFCRRPDIGQARASSIQA